VEILVLAFKRHNYGEGVIIFVAVYYLYYY